MQIGSESRQRNWEGLSGRTEKGKGFRGTVGLLGCRDL
jgi:hypothetical protein